ncbi:unnamed protein product [Adineta steineri]|uniref:DNL-type domain-containing protein n=1 Tax=Adineta steineri TaxID=433720 RepID=A0A815KIT5_9BILA|nr:unnamed protein product [Adineta steineri]CAF1393475.1 unnamed protein product [Adineta steineri]
MPNNYEKDNNINNAAIDMLMKFGDVKNAEGLFKIIKKKDIITYGAMMKGYGENNMNEKVLDLFEQIPLGINDVIYTIIFNACAQLCNDRATQIGKKLLDEMPKKFIQNNYIYNSAIDMLMRFGDVQRAEDLFKMIEKKDSISYGTMIHGYNINNEPLKSLELFEEMKESDINVDVTVLIMIIGACARIGMLSICQSVVAQIPLDLYKNRWICNSLIDMWGKAGSIKNAQEIFESIDTPDIITYTSMINAFGLNRMGLEATDLYRKISNSLHDEILYICVLNACSHSGLLDEAYSIFNEIHHKTAKIITTMIDCLSRLFLFDEAQKLIEDYEKSNPPYSAMYTAILSGARNSRNSIVSEKIYERMKLLFQNEKDTLISGSILLSNIYSSLGQHEEAQSIRLNRIKEVGKKVQPGLAWTEKDGEIAQFTAHDQSHCLSKEIYAEAERISCGLTEHGHKSDSSWITRPLAETETIQSVLCSHSERLAIAFHFIQGRKPSFIQITENLRVCGDCHQATKLIAKIRQYVTIHLQKTFTRQSYEKGVVIIRCDSCTNLHLIADNLGWFKDLTENGKFKNIAQMLQAKDETIYRIAVAPTDDESTLKEVEVDEKIKILPLSDDSNLIQNIIKNELNQIGSGFWNVCSCFRILAKLIDIEPQMSFIQLHYRKFS